MVKVRWVRKVVLHLFVWAIAIPIVLLGVLSVLLEFTELGTYSAKKLTDWLYARYSVTIQIERVGFRFPATVELQRTLVRDLKGDTLLWASNASTSLIGFAKSGHELHFANTQLHGALLHLKADSTGLNITQFFKVFKSQKANKKKKSFLLTISKIQFDDIHFKMDTPGKPIQEGRMAYQNLDFQNIAGTIQYLQVAGDSVRMDIEDLTFRERSGFSAESFHTKMSICSQFMHFKDIGLTAEKQHIQVADFRMIYDGWKAMKDFANNVILSLDLKPTTFTPRFLSYFAPIPVSDMPFVATGHMEGTVSNLIFKDIDIRAAHRSHLKIQGTLEGLPKLKESIVNVKVSECTTSLTDIQHIFSSLSPKPFAFPQFLYPLQEITYRGELVGFLDDFVAYGRLTSELGDIALDISLNFEIDTYFEGKLRTQQLNVGKLLSNKYLGKTDLLASVSGKFSKKEGLQSRAQMEINNLNFLNYTYRDIELNGDITPKSYQGQLHIRDSAFQFDFKGNVDFASEIPKFHFTATAPNIDLKQIYWNKHDSISILSFDMSAFFEGKKLDDFLGNLVFSNLQYSNTNGALNLDGLRINAFNDGKGKQITAESSAFYASLWTDNRYERFWKSIKAILAKRIPALFRESVDSEESQSNDEIQENVIYRASVIVADCDKLFEVLFPKIRVSPKSELNCYYDATSGNADIQLKSKSLGYNTITCNDVRFQLQNRDTITLSKLDIAQGQIATFNFDSLQLATSLQTDVIASVLQLKTSDFGGGELHLNTQSQIFSRAEDSLTYCVTGILPSILKVQEREWKFSRARLYLDSSAIEILNCTLMHQDRRLSIGGRLSRINPDTLRIRMDNIDIAPLEKLFPNYTWNGLVNANLTIVSPLNQLNFGGRVYLTNLEVNDVHIGNVAIQGNWAGVNRPFRCNLTNQRPDGQKDIRLNVTWDIQEKALKGDLLLDDCNLNLLSLVAKDHLSSEGSVNAKLQFNGSVTQPEVRGTLHFNNAAFRLKRFNTQIVTNDTLMLERKAIVFNEFQARDKNNNPLKINGTIAIADITRPIFDLSVQTQKFCALQTQASEELFYGQLWVSSNTRVKGLLANLQIATSLRTEAGTQLYFQLPTYIDAKENRLLEFVESKTTKETAPQPKQEKEPWDLNYTVDLNVTNEAFTQLLVNPRTGDLLRCRGEGNLKIENVPHSKDIQIFGDYTISRGEYTFILQGILSKKFRIQSGSVIHFSGAPEKGYAKITALYRAKAALERLLPTASEKYKKRVPVDCKILIEGNLQAPKIRFEIEVPQADPETQSILAAALNTEEKVMRQFASLLLMGNFMSDSRTQQTNTLQQNTAGNTQQRSDAGSSDALLSSFWELLFNNLNAWIAQIDNAPVIDFGFNYRPGDATSEDEAELSLSMQWFDGRLNVDANWDVNRNNTSSVIAGDINITQQSSLFKNLQYKAFARSNDDLVFNDLNPYTAGTGIVISDSFNSWSELLIYIKQLFSRKKEKELKVETESE